MTPDGKKRLTPTEALAKIYSYCAYQERSHLEVKKRLFNYGLNSDEVEQILSKLITDGFVNEERFAKAFAGGKFRIKKWGRLKIENELNLIGLSSRNITRGLQEIETEDYEKALRHVLEKKASLLNESDAFKKRDKLAKFAIGRGYEPDLVWRMLKEIVPL
ncbi:MAG TPA: regulatory protein RecX [Cyclobacteriaceae bacterium]|nr:regulatory protein RecX [Cyclobacteriaceae bacterium]